MSQLTLEIPNEILQPLERLARNQQKSLDELILDELKWLAIRTEAPNTTRKRIEQALVGSGLLTPSPKEQLPTPLSDAEREKLAQKLSQGETLSEWILAEREERMGVCYKRHLRKD